MDSEDCGHIIDSVIEAWGRTDVDGVLEHMADDIEFIYAIGKPPLVGKGAVRQMLEGLAKHQSDVRWRIIHRAQTGNVVLAEGIDDYINAAGHHIRTPYVGVYEFENGKIRRWRDYFDMTTLKRAEAGGPTSEWIEPLVSDARGRS